MLKGFAVPGSMTFLVVCSSVLAPAGWNLRVASRCFDAYKMLTASGRILTIPHSQQPSIRDMTLHQGVYLPYDILTLEGPSTQIAGSDAQGQ